MQHEFNSKGRVAAIIMQEAYSLPKCHIYVKDNRTLDARSRAAYSGPLIHNPSRRQSIIYAPHKLHSTSGRYCL